MKGKEFRHIGDLFSQFNTQTCAFRLITTTFVTPGDQFAYLYRFKSTTSKRAPHVSSLLSSVATHRFMHQRRTLRVRNPLH